MQGNKQQRSKQQQSSPWEVNDKEKNSRGQFFFLFHRNDLEWRQRASRSCELSEFSLTAEKSQLHTEKVKWEARIQFGAHSLSKENCQVCRSFFFLRIKFKIEWNRSRSGTSFTYKLFHCWQAKKQTTIVVFHQICCSVFLFLSSVRFACVNIIIIARHSVILLYSPLSDFRHHLGPCVCVCVRFCCRSFDCRTHFPHLSNFLLNTQAKVKMRQKLSK